MRRLLAAFFVVMSACADEDVAPADPQPGDFFGEDCAYDFELTVTAGPSAGFSVQGPLALTETFPGELIGTLATDNGAGTDITAVHGVTANGATTLRFMLLDGREIVGVSPVPLAPASDCGQRIEGDFSGPAAGDTGDWLGVIVEAIIIGEIVCCQCGGTTVGGCGNYCTQRHPSNQQRFQDCFDACIDTPPVSVCFGVPATTFGTGQSVCTQIGCQAL